MVAWCSSTDRGALARTLSVALCVACLPRVLSAAEEPARPNILLIYSDDHATQAISAYGSQINETPNIDRLAAEGIKFANCFVTNSLCAPCRAVMLTGKYSHRNGVLDNRDRFDGSQPTAPKMLRAVGYQTAVIGKWHLKTDPTGFDHWEVLPGQGAYYDPVLLTSQGKQRYQGYATDVITDLALDWLQKRRDPNRPFLLMCQHKAPHACFDPAPRHLNLYEHKEIAEPTTLFDDHSGHCPSAASHQLFVRDMHQIFPRFLKLSGPGRGHPELARQWTAHYGPENRAMLEADLSEQDQTRWNYQRYIKDYLRCIAAVDENVGRVLEYLDQSGLASNTVVVYSSDQGFFLGEHGWFDKRWIHEESIRTPLLIRWPGVVDPGSVDRHLVLNLDWAPTILEIGRAAVPDGLDGKSLLPLLLGKQSESWRGAFYYHFYEGGAYGVPAQYGVRTERHKLVHYYPGGCRELYDLEEDPHELRSRYHDPAYGAIRAQLENRLRKLQQQLGETAPEQTRLEHRAAAHGAK